MSATTIIAAPSAASCSRTSLTGYATPLKVSVYDTGDLDDEDEPDLPIGAAYWSQNIEGSPNPDKWTNWRDDFFRPAARLLVAAPWLFSRGNHELCSRGGPGWFYLLDVNSPLLGPGRQQKECPPQLPADWRPGAWPKPPALPFAGQPFPIVSDAPFRLKLGKLNIIAVNSANAADAVLYNLETYLTQYREVARMLAEDPTPTWLVTHRPVWAVVRRDKGGPIGLTSYGFINETQREAIHRVFRGSLPRHVTAVIAGHMHRFQAIGFDGPHPPHLAVGTGGMELSHVQPPPSPENPKAPVRVDGLGQGPGLCRGPARLRGDDRAARRGRDLEQRALRHRGRDAGDLRFALAGAGAAAFDLRAPMMPARSPSIAHARPAATSR